MTMMLVPQLVVTLFTEGSNQRSGAVRCKPIFSHLEFSRDSLMKMYEGKKNFFFFQKVNFISSSIPLRRSVVSEYPCLEPF